MSNRTHQLILINDTNEYNVIDRPRNFGHRLVIDYPLIIASIQ